MSKPEESDKSTGGKGLSRLEGLVSGFSELLERLNQVSEQGAEQAQQAERTLRGTFGGEPGGRKPSGVFGLSVKLGLGGNEMKVEPFGNVRRDRVTGESVVDEIREPLVDFFDEHNRVLVVAEMPGIDTEDVHVNVRDHTLELSAEHGDKKYQKHISLPQEVQPEAIKVAGQNGIFEISCPKR